jgi:hypothetical protein
MAQIVGKDEGHVKRCTCRNCASIVEYTESELRSYRASYQGDTCTEWALDCPSCKAPIVVRSN